jgi:hypothetical protein
LLAKVTRAVTRALGDPVAADPLGQRGVQLDPLGFDLEDVLKAGVAGAEVVDRHLSIFFVLSGQHF